MDPKSICEWYLYHDVVQLDATAQSNVLNMPYVVITTTCNEFKTKTGPQCIMDQETTENYEFFFTFINKV
jgi:hypothetical protein